MSEALLTAEEYLVLPDLGSPTELVRGRIVRMEFPGFEHGRLCAQFGALLGDYAEKNRLGHVLSNNAGLVTERNPDTVRGPDISFYSYSRVPKSKEPTGYSEVPPEIAIEVRSLDDSWAKMLEKISEYFNAGVDLVYVVDAPSRSVFAYTGDQPAKTLGIDDELAFPPPLDGLQMPVRRLFEP